MSNQYPVKCILPEVINERGDTVQDESIVNGYINLDEVLDYYEAPLENISMIDKIISFNDLTLNDITIVNYINGGIRYVLINYSAFNDIYIKYKNSLNKNIIKGRLN